jgi:hypothetical protein
MAANIAAISVVSYPIWPIRGAHLAQIIKIARRGFLTRSMQESHLRRRQHALINFIMGSRLVWHGQAGLMPHSGVP